MNKPSARRLPQERPDLHNAIGKNARSPVSLDAYFARQRERPARFAGQQTAEFQAALAAYHASIGPEECEFYHTIALPDGNVLQGAWDLRDHEACFLGNAELAGKTVMEFGPGSGWLSAAIAAIATRLTVFDIEFGGGPEIVPYADMDIAAIARDAAESFARLRNSWWYAKRRLGFEATAIYGDIYNLPPDLERCDVSIFGTILLHLTNPFRALEQAARLTDETIIVTDLFSAPSIPALDAVRSQVPSLAVFNPSPAPAGLTHWWAISPDLVQHMLRLLGFTEQTVTTHSPPRILSQPLMFTVVGHRPPARRPAPEKAAAPTVPILLLAAPAGSSLPVPPPELRFLVAGTEDEQVFLGLGRLGFEALTASIRRQGLEPAMLGSILEFGCGVGRVTRHWENVSGPEIHGTDLSAQMAGWAAEHLPFATIATNRVDQGLTYNDGQFGLVYALSVFTHLPVAMQLPWMRELIRVTRPGGLIYITTHGVRYVDLLAPEEAASFEQGAIVVTGAAAAGSNLCAAFHPAAWIERHFVAELDLELLEHVPCGALGNPEQDSWLFRRTA